MATHAKNYKLLSYNRLNNIEQKRERIVKWINFFEITRCENGTWADQIRRRGAEFPLPADFSAESEQIQQEVWYRVAYQGYFDREQRQIEKMSHIEKIRIPPGLDFLSIRGLRRESALKLAQFKPFTLGQASRISGVNPADISILMVLIESGRGK
jgi:tRNA uridine 5-carboxymethylaminomethyl modification enzyme